MVSLALAFFTVVLVGCADGSAAADRDDGRPLVIATTAMIGDVARNIVCGAGDKVRVETLMGPGTDPHLYRPTRSDVRRLLSADVVLYNGLHLEGRMTETFERIAATGKPVIAVAEEISRDHLLSSEDFESAFDPHVWMDPGPRGWMAVATVIAQILSTKHPAYAEEFAENLQSYLAQMIGLDEYASELIASIPEDRRVLVTAHDAFNYFARAYDIEVQPIQGISTDSEAGLRRIEELVNLLVERRIAAVFTETSVSDKNIRALIEGARARGHEVTIGGELFSDAMGPQGTYEGTYIGMIDHNVTTITRALGGEVPEGGFRARLNH